MPRLTDETGKRYGRLIVVRLLDKQECNRPGAYFLCRCDCGKEKIVSGGNLRASNVQSCGCYQREAAKRSARVNAPAPLDLQGMRFNKLVAERRNRIEGELGWLCKCDCGKTTIVKTNDLTSGKIRSCGCLRYTRDTVHAKFGRGAYYRRYIRYKLNPKNYDNMLNEQKGKCKICGNKFVGSKDIHVDHDHNCCSGRESCGKCIRGLLCERCNLMLGYAGDNIEILKNAIKYLNSQVI